MLTLKDTWATLFHRVLSSLWWVSLSVAVWVLRRSPSKLPPVRDHLLLSEIEVEEAVGNFLDLINAAARSDGLSMTESGELTFQGEGHDEDSEESGEEVQMETTLTFYCVSEIPGCLAVARFTAKDEEGKTIAITEDYYKDVEEELTRLEYETEECMNEGIDVDIMSHHDIEIFPYIYSVLSDRI